VISPRLADMLSITERVEKISFDDGSFDENDWDA
jgi:hypothetical protein